MQHFQAKWVWSVVLITVVFWGPGFRDAWQWNSRAIRLLKGETIAAKASGCNHIWLVAAEAGQRGDLPGQRRIWEQALGCSPGNLFLLAIVLPLDIDMARLATQLYPDSSQAWFWLGEAIAPTDYLGSRQAYLHVIALRPHHGLAWCRLGRNYESDGGLEIATQAWLNCCYHGDPGSNGCYGAGRMMEQLGNLPKAIEYYHLSRWDGAQKRADELEDQLSP